MDVTVAAPVSEHSAVFVVNCLEIDYRLPARWYDASIVTLIAVERGGGHLAIAQEVHRAPDLMAGTRVSLACVNPAPWRPTRIRAAAL
jgi:acyl-CoA thioesterase FadM